MRLLRIRNAAMAGALGVAGLGLIGLGAHATFTQNAYTQQVITAGSMDVVLSSAGGSWSYPTLTMAAVGPTGVGSNFTTGDQAVTITNDGNITVTGMTLSFSDPYSNTFDSEAQICVFYGGAPLYNNSFDNFTGSIPVALNITPGGTDTFYVNVYAGSGGSACGNDGAASLTNGAMGETVEPTLTAVFTG